jgi:hypothetical protein
MAGEPPGLKMARETAVGFGWGVIALIGMLTEKRKEGEKAGARQIHRACGGGRRARGRRKEGGKRGLTGGAHLSTPR